ncbi:MAG: hypothetical protein M1812_005771 [Candelaria pacifica]|nr:MAG: hypothetical protein M1812_005771 [Candelaria pacifica]
MLDSSSSSSLSPPTQKRAASTAGLRQYNRPAKRRASRACQCCRTRKVRCNVVENGSPCTNCKMDDVECVITESKRRNKLDTLDTELVNHCPNAPISSKAKSSTSLRKKMDVAKSKKSQVQPKVSQLPSAGVAISPVSPSRPSFEPERDHEHHVPHLICKFIHSLVDWFQKLIFASDQNQSRRLSLQDRIRRPSMNAPVRPLLPHLLAQPAILHPTHSSHNPNFNSERRQDHSLPSYIKPPPPQIASDDIQYLEKKEALSVPPVELRNELLRSYIEYVHGFLPLLELSDSLRTIDGRDGSGGKLSLLLFQAVMFAGTAFVDEIHLRNAGFSSRKVARKAFYQKARLLYDFDYEPDRLSIVQALLLMTYWHDNTDDEKDTWHWMGVAISLSYTIGLHRNPDSSTMSVKRQRLWKRIWWSCLMRDRLVALGMRRPTRIKDGDHDVPMLTMADFELQPVADDITCVPPDCAFGRSTEMQRQMAILCIEKANLCLCVGHVLTAQYSVLNNNLGMRTAGGNFTTTMMLVPRKPHYSSNETRLCDVELAQWYEGLPNAAIYRTSSRLELAAGNAPLVVHRGLLHMIYNTAVSALHRPQVPPDVTTITSLQEQSRLKVQYAATEITAVVSSLRHHNLAHYLPTAGVTVLLPALIIHLLEIKSSNEGTRVQSMQRFTECMEVMKSLQTIYASADSAMNFLQMAIQKAGIDMYFTHASPTQVKTEDLLQEQTPCAKPTPALTPPPDSSMDGVFVEDDEVAKNLQTFLAANTPPDSEENELSPGTFQRHDDLVDCKDFETDFGNLVNFEAIEVSRSDLTEGKVEFEPREDAEAQWS